jgi:hypothetical protein
MECRTLLDHGGTNGAGLAAVQMGLLMGFYNRSPNTPSYMSDALPDNTSGGISACIRGDGLPGLWADWRGYEVEWEIGARSESK